MVRLQIQLHLSPAPLKPLFPLFSPVLYRSGLGAVSLRLRRYLLLVLNYYGFAKARLRRAERLLLFAGAIDSLRLYPSRRKALQRFAVGKVP